MKFRYPSYYEKFRCIADRCEDTCCAGWEIDIDDASYEYYMGVEGAFGERLRANIKEYDAEAADVYEQHGFVLKENRRCPFLDEHNLCDIYRELGEDALCSVCTDTPRNYLEYGGAREVSLSASCAEAGRLIYGDASPMTFVEKEIAEELEWEESEEELQLAEQIRQARDVMIGILQDRSVDIQVRVRAYIAAAKEVQKYLNEDDLQKMGEIDWGAFLRDSTMVEEVGRADIYRLFLERMRTFSGMESISEEWESVLRLLHERYVEPDDGMERYRKETDAFWTAMENEGRLYEYEHLLVYYSFLCLSRCVDDYDFLGKAKLAVVSFLMIRDMDCATYAEQNQVYTKADRVRIARIYAKEVEHSGENMEYLADEFLFEDTYTPQNLCASLTSVQI